MKEFLDAERMERMNGRGGAAPADPAALRAVMPMMGGPAPSEAIGRSGIGPAIGEFSNPMARMGALPGVGGAAPPPGFLAGSGSVNQGRTPMTMEQMLGGSSSSVPPDFLAGAGSVNQGQSAMTMEQMLGGGEQRGVLARLLVAAGRQGRGGVKR